MTYSRKLNMYLHCRYTMVYTSTYTRADPRGTPLPPKITFFGVKSCFCTRNTPKMFAPPSARPNFFKCAPPNPGSAPAHRFCY